MGFKGVYITRTCFRDDGFIRNPLKWKQCDLASVVHNIFNFQSFSLFLGVLLRDNVTSSVYMFFTFKQYIEIAFMGLGGIRVRIFNSYGQFSYTKVGFKGVYISRTYYPDFIISSYPWIGMSWNLRIWSNILRYILLRKREGASLQNLHNWRNSVLRSSRVLH